MSANQAQRGLAAQAKSNALAVARRAAERNRRPDPVRSERRNQLIADLPDLQRARALQQILTGLSIENPYHRMHAAHATTTSIVDNRDCLNFSSYDYLGLNADPRPIAAACEALKTYGVSASASRMVAGERPVHRDLEAGLAEHYRAEAAQVFVSGHATNVTVIDALVGERDAVLHDSFIHNSISSGAKGSGAARRSFAHNDMDALEFLLEQTRPAFRNILVVIEGLYSMDGDVPDLPRLIELKDRYGVWLMVDEAHALGCVGKTGRGAFEHFGIDPSSVDVWMGTLSKTLASTGGYIAGSADLIDHLRNNASGFVYSVALPPVLAASAFAALEIMHSEPERVERLQANGRHFLGRAREMNLDTGLSAGVGVLPVIVGDSALATKLSERLFQRGINVAPVTFPGVPMQSARLRFFLSASHTPDQIDQALFAVHEELEKLRRSGFADRITTAMAALGVGQNA